MCDVFVGPRVSAPSCVGPSVVSLASRSTASVCRSLRRHPADTERAGHGHHPPCPEVPVERLRLEQWHA
jgi:hypothetical protein